VPLMRAHRRVRAGTTRPQLAVCTCGRWAASRDARQRDGERVHLTHAYVHACDEVSN
jgi:hypothetical protein